MIPLIVVANNSKKSSDFIDDFVKKNNINKNNIFYISPEKKEFTINQIRNIKKEVVYAFSEPCLYILESFDLASYEAQNAFLKTLEEHNANVNFILLVKNYKHLASTVLSRSKVVTLDKTSSILIDKNFERLLGELISSGNLSILGSSTFQTKLIPDPLLIFDKLIYFFKRRLKNDINAGKILREILNMRFLVQHNNINPQYAIDHLLIFIRNTYNNYNDYIK